MSSAFSYPVITLTMSGQLSTPITGDIEFGIAATPMQPSSGPEIDVLGQKPLGIPQAAVTALSAVNNVANAVGLDAPTSGQWLRKQDALNGISANGQNNGTGLLEYPCWSSV